MVCGGPRHICSMVSVFFFPRADNTTSLVLACYHLVQQKLNYHKNNISLKHSRMESCFINLIARNIIVQIDHKNDELLRIYGHSKFCNHKMGRDKIANRSRNCF